MKIALAREMKEIDRIAIEQYCIPSEILMENAAVSLFEEIRSMVDVRRFSLDSLVSFPLGSLGRELHFLVLVGTGNNGGDALALTRHLIRDSFVTLALPPRDSFRTLETRRNYDTIMRHLDSGRIQIIDLSVDAVMACGRPDFIIDGIYGIGFKGELDRSMSALFDSVNRIRDESGSITVSIDIPSGLDPDRAKVQKSILADMTVTFGLPKAVHLYTATRVICGEVRIRDISIPEPLLRSPRFELITFEKVRGFIKPRDLVSHKYTFGSVLIVAGDHKMLGASILAASAALRAGCGIVRLAINADDIAYIVPRLIPEIMLCYESEILEQAKLCQAVLIGPGLGVSAEKLDMVKMLIRECTSQLILDADALNLIARDDLEILNHSVNPVILTPHVAEFARLMVGVDRNSYESVKDSIQTDPLSNVLSFVKRIRCTVALKSQFTLIASSDDGSSYLNINGTPKMATAGSGDVLAGMVASMVAQSQSSKISEIVSSAVYIHSLAAQIASKNKSSLIASDLIDKIPDAISEIIGIGGK